MFKQLFRRFFKPSSPSVNVEDNWLKQLLTDPQFFNELLRVFKAPSTSTKITILSWNLEDGNGVRQVTKDPKVAEALQRTQPGILCFSEVPNWNQFREIKNWANTKLGGNWDIPVISGNVAGDDKLGILFDAAKFTLVEANRLTGWITQGERGYRNPLSVVLVSQETGAEFEVITVHPNRRSGAKRGQQFRFLAEYMLKAERPVLLVGDTNGDFNPQTGEANPEFAQFLEAVSAKYALAQFLGKTPVTGTCNQRFQTLLDLLIVPQNVEAIIDYLFDEERQRQCIQENSDHFPLIGHVTL
ncbi:MAG: hypothetical protein ACK5UY_05825 [Holosporales bacterium]